MVFYTLFWHGSKKTYNKLIALLAGKRIMLNHHILAESLTGYSLANTDRQRNWHEEQPGPGANSEVGSRCSLHLPAFVIVPYYCPYFSSAHSKLSLRLLPRSPAIPCYALLCECLDQASSGWMTDCFAGKSIRSEIMHGGAIFCYKCMIL